MLCFATLVNAMKTHLPTRLKTMVMAGSLLLPVALAGACLAALLFATVWRLAAAPTTGPRAEIVRVCVSVRLTGSPRLATWWAPAFNSRTGLMRHAFLQSNMACGLAGGRQPALQTSN